MRTKRNKSNVSLTLGRAETARYEAEDLTFGKVLRAIVLAYVEGGATVEVYASASRGGYTIGQWSPER